MSIATLAHVVGGDVMRYLIAMLIEASLKGSILLALAWVAVRTLRNASAASRHLVWASALGGTFLMPLLDVVMPGVGVPVLPAVERTTEVVAARVIDVPNVVVVPRTPAAVAELPMALPAASRPSLVERLDWAKVIGLAPLLWLVVSALVLLRVVAGTMRLSVWTRRARRVDDDAWLSLAHRLAARLDITRPVRLLRSDRACVPMTWGVVYPTVLLPDDADDWTSERRTIVLLHELAHVKRLDALTQLVAQFAIALFWFNPLVWLAARQMRREREHACDDFVLRGGARATDYAHDLLQIARSLGGASAPASAALAMARHSEFEGRLLAILDPTANRHSVSRTRLVLATVSVLVLALPLAALTPAAPLRSGAPPAPDVVGETPSTPNVGWPRLAPLAPRPPIAAQAPLAPEIAPLAPTPVVTTPGATWRIPSIDRVAPVSLVQATPVVLVANGPPDRETLIAVARHASKMTSDYEKAELLLTVAKHYMKDDELRTAYLDAVGSMTSSYEQARTLAALLLKDDLPPYAAEQVVKVAGKMSSDNDKATLLVKVMTDHDAMTPGLRDAAIASAATIGSDAERGRVSSAIAKSGGLTNPQLIDLIDVIKGISGSFAKASALVDVSSRYPLSDKQVRDAFLQAAETISSSYDYLRVIRR